MILFYAVQQFHCKAIAWHPDVATQMITASEDDRSPIVQVSNRLVLIR